MLEYLCAARQPVCPSSPLCDSWTALKAGVKLCGRKNSLVRPFNPVLVHTRVSGSTLRKECFSWTCCLSTLLKKINKNNTREREKKKSFNFSVKRFFFRVIRPLRAESKHFLFCLDHFCIKKNECLRPQPK